MAYYSPFTLISISKLTASSSATISFTSAITSSFSNYKIEIRDMVAATDITTLKMLMSTDNGATYLNTNYKWLYQYITSNAGNTLSNSNSDSSISLTGKVSNSSSRGLTMDLFFFDLNSGTYSPKYNGYGVQYDSSSEGAQIIIGGANTITTAVNALQFSMSSGNITSGTFTLYGVNTN